MEKMSPDRRVGIVTFGGEVMVIGDGTMIPQTITGDKLLDYEHLMSNGGTEAAKRMANPIKDTKESLQKSLLSMEENGPTALGPALTTAIAMAAMGGAGSKVILCTDGLANVGIGAFDEIKNDDEFKKVEDFYDKVGEFAKGKGVVVSIVSIEGEECNIDTISRISEHTGGEVNRVNPVELTKNFANILASTVIASNVVLRVKLHKGLEFRNEPAENLSEDRSLLARDLGSVTEETEVTFEYRLRAMKELLKMHDIDLTQIKELPFQCQITYKALDGSKCIRVLTDLKEVSSDKK